MESRSTRRKTCSSATLFKTNLTWLDQRSMSSHSALDLCWNKADNVSTGVLKSPKPDLFPDGFFYGENISFDASVVIYTNSTNIPPIVIVNRIYEHQNLL